MHDLRSSEAVSLLAIDSSGRDLQAAVLTTYSFHAAAQTSARTKETLPAFRTRNKLSLLSFPLLYLMLGEK